MLFILKFSSLISTITLILAISISGSLFADSISGVTTKRPEILWEGEWTIGQHRVIKVVRVSGGKISTYYQRPILALDLNDKPIAGWPPYVFDTVIRNNNYEFKQ